MNVAFDYMEYSEVLADLLSTYIFFNQFLESIWNDLIIQVI